MGCGGGGGLGWEGLRKVVFHALGIQNGTLDPTIVYTSALMKYSLFAWSLHRNIHPRLCSCVLPIKNEMYSGFVFVVEHFTQ